MNDSTQRTRHYRVHLANGQYIVEFAASKSEARKQAKEFLAKCKTSTIPTNATISRVEAVT